MYTTTQNDDGEDVQTINGVYFTYESDENCTVATESEPAVNRSFRTTVTCDADATETTLTSGPTIDGCQATVAYTGPAGCPLVSFADELTFIQENVWLQGLILLVVGPFVALMGVRMFPYVVATIGSFTTIMLLYLLFASMGFCDDDTGFWISISIALAAGIAVGCFVRRAIWVTVGLVSTAGGIFAGMLLFVLCNSLFDLEAEWALWVFVVLGGLAGFFAGCKLGRAVVNISTSFIGSYFFTRALTMFFWTDHWPSETDIVNGTLPDDLGYQFWIFFAILVISTISSSVIQKNAGEDHEDLDEYDRMK